MRWAVIVGLLALGAFLVALPLLLSGTSVGSGCVDGTLEQVDAAGRAIVVDGHTLLLRGMYESGEESVNAWDLTEELSAYVGQSVHVCYEEGDKVSEIEVGGKVWRRWEHG